MERPKKPFSLLRRPTARKNRHIYYVKFRDSDSGNYLTPMSTGTTNRHAAEAWVWEFLKKNPVIKYKRVITFSEYATTFWDYDQSPYVQNRLMRGYSLSKTYIRICSGHMTKYVIPVIGKKKLEDITTKDLDELILDLYRAGDISPTTVNRIISSIRVLFGEAFRLGEVPANPAQNLAKVKELPNVRGVFSKNEVLDLFDETNIQKVWGGDISQYTINLLSASTGMRQGEIRGLLVKHARRDMVEVKHSWEDKVGLKGCKWGSERIVPIPSRVSRYLETVIEMLKRKDPDCLVFPGISKNAPVSKNLILDSLRSALKNIGIDEKVQKDRGLAFHSWRHWFNSLCRAESVPDSKLQKITGHKTQEMTEHYTHFNLDDFKDVQKIQRDFFG